jgi:hypothetical protein
MSEARGRGGRGVDEIVRLYKAAAASYNKQRPHLGQCRSLAKAALAKLAKDAAYAAYSTHSAHGIKTKYSVFRDEQVVSRPVASGLFESDTLRFEALDQAVIDSLTKQKVLSAQEIEAVTRYVYTAVMSFAVAYDLWKPGSRKTPGTFFEVLMAGLVGLHLPQHSLSKHVNLGAMLGDDDTAKEEEAVEATVSEEDTDESSVSTDLVIKSSAKEKWAVVPLKITTRERVVQPFAHQRILESCFPGKFHSFLCCISETQLDKKTATVNQICVPGTIKLFQKYLSRIEGLYYADIPARYAQESLTRYIAVKTLGEFFNDARALLDREAK